MLVREFVGACSMAMEVVGGDSGGIVELVNGGQGHCPDFVR